MDNRSTSAQPLNRGTAIQRNISSRNSNTENKNDKNIEWRTYFTPERLKLFHTIVLIMFLVLIMSYIFNTKSNVLRVVIILSLSAFMICESFVVYSYRWTS